MIQVRMWLRSAVTGKVTRLAGLDIGNDGTGTRARGNYRVRLLDKRDRIRRETRVMGFPRQSRSAQELLRRALLALAQERKL